MDPRLQFLASTELGAVLFVLFVGYRYWKRLSWALGSWDPNLGHENEGVLISSANWHALAIGVVLALWSVGEPSPVRQNWELEVFGWAIGMLIAYVVLVLTASALPGMPSLVNVAP